MGKTSGMDTKRPMFELVKGADGAISPDGRVEGTYVHGVFSSDAYRGWWLESLKPGLASQLQYDASIELELDALADGLEEVLDIDALFKLAT